MASLRTLLIVGRVSNLPTVWSNCIAGWWLGGGGNFEKLPWLLLGTTLLYGGGMFLNDVFDSEFDRAYRKERPIPSGKISHETVWRWSWILLGIGSVILISQGTVTGVFAVLLLLCIVIYDMVHKATELAPVLMGACRLLLFLAAASCGNEGVTGASVWCGLVLMSYIVGLSCIARVETTPGALRFWPLIFLAAPIVLALLMNSSNLLKSAMLLSVILGLWILRNLRFIFSGEKNVGKAVGGLLAGIVLVDFLAVTDFPMEQIWIFPVLFFVARIFQRFIPAT